MRKTNKNNRPAQPAPRLLAARLVFVATLPDGHEAFAFVTADTDAPLLLITAAGTLAALPVTRKDGQ